MGKLFFSKIDKIDWKKFQKFSIFKKFYYLNYISVEVKRPFWHSSDAFRRLSI